MSSYQAYELLPAEVKRALQTAVIELDSYETYRYVNKYGIEAALESIERVNDKWASKPLWRDGFNSFVRSSYVECGVRPLT